MRSSRVYTPKEIARALVGRLCRGLGPCATWLEPSCGDGALVREIAGAGYPRGAITAVDISTAAHGLDALAQVEQGVDFIEWSRAHTSKYDVIVANPPYMKLARVPHELRRVALEVPNLGGGQIPRTSNYWYVFFCRAAKMLKRGGHIAFILPASWSHADYARPGREWAARSFSRVEVFRCRGPFFPNVGEGNTIVICKNFQGTPATHAELRDVDDVAALLAELSRVNGHAVTRARRGGHGRARRSTTYVSAREILAIRIGIVSGDSRYFLMTETQRKERELPEAACWPTLSRSRHLTKANVTRSDWQAMRKADERVWLFHPSGSTLNDPAVKRYIADGGCRREGYKVRARKGRWFQPPKPAAFDGFSSGMMQTSPWVALRRMRGLVATNTLYLIRFVDASTLDEKAAWAMTLLCASVREQVDARVRRYAQGLGKLEPSDIYGLVLPRPRVEAGILEAYELAVERAAAGDFAGANQLCERWIL